MNLPRKSSIHREIVDKQGSDILTESNRQILKENVSRQVKTFSAQTTLIYNLPFYTASIIGYIVNSGQTVTH